MSQKQKKTIADFKARKEQAVAIGRMRQSTRDFLADVVTITNSYGEARYGR